jgi:NAD(P)-dependent dehydrogenase (short-subunit alcohol dehydrogenase family)
MDANEKILVLGGTGHLGARICRRLADIAGSELIITSRDLFRAEVLVDELSERHPNSRISALALDQESPDLEAKLRAIRPFVVVHTAGPYQGQSYRVARGCIDAGSHYVDLADGRTFVADFGTLDEQAQAADVLLVTGAGTLPGVSGAVVDGLRDRFHQIEEIEMAVAPAHRTPRGLAMVAAALSYCGRPIPVLIRGEWQTLYGWQDLRRQRFPGLGARLSGACDVPDLELLPRYVPGVRTVMFHVALEAEVEQLTLWWMAWLTRRDAVQDWSRYARTFMRLGRSTRRLGSNKGGMRIRLAGAAADGSHVEARWSLLALDNHGPEIPCTPSVVLVRKLLRNEILGRGARPCLGLFTAQELLDELRDFSVSMTLEVS